MTQIKQKLTQNASRLKFLQRLFGSVVPWLQHMPPVVATKFESSRGEILAALTATSPARQEKMRCIRIFDKVRESRTRIYYVIKKKGMKECLN